jgi:hypothetical protein
VAEKTYGYFWQQIKQYAPQQGAFSEESTGVWIIPIHFLHQSFGVALPISLPPNKFPSKPVGINSVVNPNTRVIQYQFPCFETKIYRKLDIIYGAGSPRLLFTGS